MFLITWMMWKQEYLFKVLEIKLQELPFSEELWHNLGMCLASGVHGGMLSLQVVSSGEGCVVITESQTPISMTESFLY